MTITIADEELAGTLKSMEIEVPKRTQISAMKAFAELLRGWDKQKRKSEEEVYDD